MNTGLISTRTSRVTDGPNSPVVDVDQVFAQLLLGTGIAGLLPFLGFYWIAARGIWLHRKTRIGMIVFPWFATAFVGSLALNLEISKWYWLITALALAVPKVCSRIPNGGREEEVDVC